MTKLLVLSDSHGARGAIERILNKEQNNVDAVIFLGDGLRDLEQTLAFFPHLRVYFVAGNCDSGCIELKGRVSSLLELGAGFHPDMRDRKSVV